MKIISIIFVFFISLSFYSCKKETMYESNLEFSVVDTFTLKPICDKKIKITVGYKKGLLDKKFDWVDYETTTDKNGIIYIKLLRPEPDTIVSFFNETGFFGKKFCFQKNKSIDRIKGKYQMHLVPKYQIPYRVIIQFYPGMGPKMEEITLGTCGDPFPIEMKVEKQRVIDSSDVYYFSSTREKNYKDLTIYYYYRSGETLKNEYYIGHTSHRLYPGVTNRFVINGYKK